MPPIHPPVASLLLGRRIVKVSDRGPTPAQSARNGIGGPVCVCLALTLFIGFVPDSMRVRGGGRRERRVDDYQARRRRVQLGSCSFPTCGGV